MSFLFLEYKHASVSSFYDISGGGAVENNIAKTRKLANRC